MRPYLAIPVEASPLQRHRESYSTQDASTWTAALVVLCFPIPRSILLPADATWN